MTIFTDWVPPIAPSADIELAIADEQRARKRRLEDREMVGVSFLDGAKFYLTAEGDLVNPLECDEIPFDGSTPFEEQNREIISAYLDSRDAAGYPTDYV